MCFRLICNKYQIIFLNNNINKVIILLNKINKMKNKIVIFKNIRFFDYSFKKILKIILKGGLLVAPAASALIELRTNKLYKRALVNSNIAIFDSGFFCLLLKIFKKISVTKLSGYKFLKLFLEEKSIKNIKILLVNPTNDEGKSNLRLLKKKNFKKIISYTAPFYKKFRDIKLLRLIKREKPKIIIINIGGGKQEPLGYYLNKNLRYNVSIICTGAAIAFLTKKQAPVNDVIDKFYLGWFVRILYNPSNLNRLFDSFKLFSDIVNSNIRVIRN